MRDRHIFIVFFVVVLFPPASPWQLDILGYIPQEQAPPFDYYVPLLSASFALFAFVGLKPFRPIRSIAGLRDVGYGEKR